MSREYKPRVLTRRWALVLCLTIALAVAASISGGAERLSIEEVGTSLRQQRRKIESLHVRIRRLTRLFVDPKILATWPSQPALPKYQGTDEVLIAFKGDKRYSRLLELDYKPRSPAGSSAEPESGTRRYLDEAKAWAGKVLLERNRNLQSGKFEYRSTTGHQARDCFQPSPYLMNVGLAVPDPTGKDQARATFRQIHLLEELLRRWPYEVLEKAEEADGARCVVLEGRVECRLPPGNESETKRFDDRLWLDLEHGLALRKRETLLDGRLRRLVNSDFAEVLPGYWLPKLSRTKYFGPSKAPEDRDDGPVLVRRMRLLMWVVNQVPDDLFDIALTKPLPPRVPLALGWPVENVDLIR